MASALRGLTLQAGVGARRIRRDGFALAPPATLALFLAPIALGLLGTLLPSFGLHPALGLSRVSLAPWAELLRDPSLPEAVRVSLVTGFGAALLSLLIAFSACAAFHHHAWFTKARALLAPALAFPHASFAVGMAFLLAPSGWLARLFSPWATGWERPPDLLIVQDPNGFALLFALTLKESLFLLLMILAALSQTEPAPSLRAARSLGYGPVRAWLLVVAPRVYSQLRLPIYAVLAASLAHVEMALILGPAAPPTLAPMALSWFTHFDLALQTKASAAAILQLLLAGGAIGLWRLGEIAVARLARPWLSAGRRSGPLDRLAAWIGGAGLGASFGLSALAGLALLLWSLAGRWSWPGALPQSFSLAAWAGAGAGIGELAGASLLAGALSTAIALVLVIACLEAEQDAAARTRRALLLLYVPLLLPQIGFLFGVQVLLAGLQLDGSLAAVVWTHLLFVLPYVFLAFSDPFRALDPRLARTARSLGASRLRTLLYVKLPLLLRPLAIAAAIGFTVSLSLYLPTVLAGAGRFETLATETVALAAGGDRRVLGATAFSQTALPFLALWAALALPAWAARARRGLAA